MSQRRSILLAPLTGALILSLAVAVPAFAASAKENFQRYCIQCHGSEGRGDGVNANATKELGAAPKDLTNAEALSRLSDDRIANIIAKGGSRNELSALMPPWGNTLRREEIQGLVQFIRDLCKCTFKP